MREAKKKKRGEERKKRKKNAQRARTLPPEGSILVASFLLPLSRKDIMYHVSPWSCCVV
jgi:hypothetical protein